MTHYASFSYMPVDISYDAVSDLVESVRNILPDINVEGKVGDYFEMMDEINQSDHNTKVLLFLGSNIGNYTEHEALDFLGQLSARMTKGDFLFIGFDLKKHPRTILNAYHDKSGITARFNLNLLTRLNNELGANFNTEKFIHAPFYDAENGRAVSCLLSTQEQHVFIRELNRVFTFKPWEAIHTEISQKYDVRMIEQFAETTGFDIIKNYSDSRGYFVDSLWKRR
jgi:uncharacterized SAM-dependent methyltransferase